jgi:hypothetical protein
LTGVYGYSSGNVDGPTAPAKTGVYGYAIQDANARGITGESTAGRGVNGLATTGTGVYGKATDGEGMRGVSASNNGAAGTTAAGGASGIYGENTGGGFGTYGRSNTGAGYGVFGEAISGTGVEGYTATGTGVLAVASDSGTALQTQGPVSFSTSGLTPIAVGGKSKQIAPITDITASSKILCTVESNQATLFVRRITKNAGTDTFTVFLSEPVAVGKYAKVAWFVLA